MKRIRVHIHLDHGRSAGSWTHALPAEELIGRLDYGYGHAAPYAHITWSQDHREGRLMRFFRRGLAYAVGFDAVHAVDLNAAQSHGNTAAGPEPPGRPVIFPPYVAGSPPLFRGASERLRAGGDRRTP